MTVSNAAVKRALRAQATPALPVVRAWEDVRFTPTVGTPYVDEQYLPPVGLNLGLTQGGTLNLEGEYVLRWFNIPNTGDTTDFEDALDALLARFTPGSYVTASDGSTVRIRGDVVPSRSQILNQGGWARSTVTIPFRVLTNNQ